MEKFYLNVIGSIIGGLIVALASWAIMSKYRRIRHWKFKKIFGQDADKDGKYYIVYGKLSLPETQDEKGKKITHPYSKRSRGDAPQPFDFSMEAPISSCEVRAANYLASALGSEASNNAILTSDEDIDEVLNLSFISIGGPGSNWKTDDALRNESNRFVTFDHHGFVSAKSRELVFTPEEGFDYGLILRIRPDLFRNRVWIVCAGFGEWGSSGAAWYLANKWEELLKIKKSWSNPRGIYRETDFAAIVRVQPRRDESAKLIRLFRTELELEMATEEVKKSVGDISLDYDLDSSASPKDFES